MSMKDDYVELLKSQIDLWSAELDTLSARADLMGAEAKLRVEEQLVELGKMRDEGVNRLAELQSVGEEVADEVADELKETADRLRGSFDEALKKVKSHFN
jgi:hypothetical protein